jgi:hypothetical protein
MRRFLYVVACMLQLLASSMAVAAPNDKPIIGVLTVGPTGSDCGTFMKHHNSINNSTIIDNVNGNGCFTVYYVKWIEAAGGILSLLTLSYVCVHCI